MNDRMLEPIDDALPPLTADAFLPAADRRPRGADLDVDVRALLEREPVHAEAAHDRRLLRVELHGHLGVVALGIH